MDKTCENCRWVPNWRGILNSDYADIGICKYPAELKYIGNPKIFIENEFSAGYDTIVIPGTGEAYNSNLPCPKWEEPERVIDKVCQNCKYDDNCKQPVSLRAKLISDNRVCAHWKPTK